MGVGDVLVAILVGLLVGVLARLVVPGRQRMGLLLTLALGLVGAFLGGWLGAAVGAGGFLTFLLMVAVAALLVFLVAGRGRSRYRARI